MALLLACPGWDAEGVGVVTVPAIGRTLVATPRPTGALPLGLEVAVRRVAMIGVVGGAVACSSPSTDDGPGSTASSEALPADCQGHGTDGATATCLRPTMPPEYYVDEALKYFDTLDVSADRDRVPTYHPLVARWEWPPWLLLTGYGADDMTATADALRVLDPSTVPERDCRFFEVQPFARCRIVFEYDDGLCPIYEEFVFNDAGETTFIEAWSDLPGWLPHTDPDDPWAERHDIGRLSTRVPGLGNATGTLDLDGDAMAAAAAVDPDVADFAERASDWQSYWFQAYAEADPDFFAQGCGW